MNYTTIIGLEIHIEPNTITKMFCGCPQDHFGKKPNSQTCPICLGLPGALPYANYEAIKKTIILGLALNSNISKHSNFYRKHYFYPDLPKSFQTSQKDNPFCVGGELLGKKINHIHLEEDAGKLIHRTVNDEKVSLVDFNRSGCALIELVTEPVFRSSDEVLVFTKELQMIARYLDISGADMEKGTMRLEANISLAKKPSTKLPDYKVELKNINSFRFLSNAIEAEVERQKNALDKGQRLIQETRGYDEIKKITFSQRSKEESQDYRYFPEADLPPVIFADKDVSELKKLIPELPAQKRERFISKFKLPQNYAEILTTERDSADFYEKTMDIAVTEKLNPKDVSNLIINKGLKGDTPKEVIKNAINILNKSFADEGDVKRVVAEVLVEQKKAVEEYKAGKVQVIGFLIGQVQKRLEGKGDPSSLRNALQKVLK